MPTENRSSNTEQMVSVPRSLLEEAYNGLRITQDRARKELRALLAQPSDQHQGEPVALPRRRTEDHFSEKLRDKAEGWNAYHDEMAKLGPLYTHPDAGEVEQLSRVIRDLNDERDEVGAECSRLRAQLAERDALLRDINKRHSSGVDFDLPADLAARVTALSASAEPSAPVELDEQAEFMAWANKEYEVAPDEELNLKNPSVRDNKIGWLARAALERKP